MRRSKEPKGMWKKTGEFEFGLLATGGAERGAHFEQGKHLRKMGSRSGRTRRKQTKLYLITFFSLLVTGLAFAEVAIETSVSRSRLSVGEELALDIIITNAQGNISHPTLTSIDGFSSYSQGRSQEISIINGQTTSRHIFSYVLIANATGKRIIGPFEVNIGGRNYKAAAVEVEVVPDTGYAPGARSGSFSSGGPVYSPPPRALPSGDISREDIFVKAWLDKDEVTVNEPVILTYTIYTRLSATYKGFDKEPVTTGFWVEDFPPEKTMKKTEQVLNGRRYVVADVRKLALFPTQAGIFTLDTGVISSVVEVRQQDDFDSFFSFNVFGRRGPTPSPFITTQIFQKALNPDKAVLTVKALPEAGKPPSFTGAVGDYRIESSIDKKQVEAGDPVTLRVRIIGQGNINTVQTPPLPKLEDFRVYDSSSSANVSKERLVVEGEKITETVLVPKKPGTYTIPPLNFSYFDPKARAYKEIKTQPHTLSVQPGTMTDEEESPAAGGVRPVEKEDLTILSQDIRYIKTDDGNSPRALPPFYREKLYWILNGALLALSVVFMFLSFRRERDGADPRGARSRRFRGVARKRLKSAAALLKKDKHDEFYAEIAKALSIYFADKLDVPVQSVNADLIAESFADRDVEPEILNQTRQLFDELAHGRFSSMQKSKEDMKAMYEEVDRLITRFEKVKLK